MKGDYMKRDFYDVMEYVELAVKKKRYELAINILKDCLTQALAQIGELEDKIVELEARL